MEKKIILTGVIYSREKLKISTRGIVLKVVEEIGFGAAEGAKPPEFEVLDLICQSKRGDNPPALLSNDQSIVTGYAGYGKKTRFLPPEQFLAWYLRGAILESLSGGILAGQGPDGKVMVVVVEDKEGFKPEVLLISLQHRSSTELSDLQQMVAIILEKAWGDLQDADSRWRGRWKDFRLVVNPNGAFFTGGSTGDNGQTGRKSVMDFYGPRIPFGGGAFYGKDFFHIDRLAACQARKLAIDLSCRSGGEVIVQLCYAPGLNRPLSVDIRSEIRPELPVYEFFSFDSMLENISLADLDYDCKQLGSFYNPNLSFNQPFYLYEKSVHELKSKWAAF